MAYESDEEQIEALKDWWKENGTSLIIGVVIVLVVLFGSRYWRNTEVSGVEEASSIYQNMAETVLTNPLPALLEADLEEVVASNLYLRDVFPKSIYTRYSALLMAKVYVEQKDLEQAVEQLQWVLANPKLGFLDDSEEELFLTTRLRLGRIFLAQGEAQNAINLLNEVESMSFSSSYAEIVGDAHLALGQIGDARAAYLLALETAENPDLLNLKIEDLGQ